MAAIASLPRICYREQFSNILARFALTIAIIDKGTNPNLRLRSRRFLALARASAGLLPLPNRFSQPILLMWPLTLRRIDGCDRVVPSQPPRRAAVGSLGTTCAPNRYCCVLACTTSFRWLRARRCIASAYAGSRQICWHVSCSQTLCARWHQADS